MTDSSANPRNYGERPLHEDDPLMELSRIFDFGAPAENNARDDEARQDDWRQDDRAHERAEPDFDPALDLERELLGNFDDFAEPEADDRSVSAVSYDERVEQYSSYEQTGFSQAASGHERGEVYDTQPAPQPESPESLEFVEADRSEPVPQFDYADYSRARDSHHDAHAATEDDDPSIYQPAIEPNDKAWRTDTAANGDWDVQPVEASAQHHVAETAQAPLSLEDELENLLFGDEPQEKPVSYAHAREEEQQEEQPASFAAYEAEETAYEEPAFDDRQSGAAQDYAEPEQGYAPAVETEAASYAPAPVYPHYPRGNFSPDSAPSTVLSRQPHPAETVGEANPAEIDDFSFGDDFSFDAEDGSASLAEATDDEFSAIDDITLNEQDFGFEPSGDQLSSSASTPQEDEFFNEEDFFNADDLDLADDAGVTEEPAYAHAVRADDEPRAGSFSFQTPPRSLASEPAPEIETLSVAEEKVEQTFSLDLPDVNYGEDESNAGLTDLEAEFAEVFSTIGVDEAAAAQNETQSEADKAFEDIFRDSVSSYLPSGGAALGLGAAAAAAATATAYGRSSPSAAGQTAPQGGAAGSQDDFYNHWAAQGAQTLEGEDYGARAAAQPEDDLGSAAEAYRNRPVRGRRGLILASVAGVAVLLGGIGYHFLGGGESGEPVVIRADGQPTKVQPENPGGVTVPNQNKAVYDRVAGTLPNNPEQKALISSNEQPVDLATTEDGNDDAPDETGGSAAPAAPSAQQNDQMIQPREVETMIVRPDGTIVRSEPAETAPSQPASPNPVAANPAPAAGTDEIGALASGNATPEPTPAPAPVQVAPVPAQPAATTTPKPVRAPVVPSRPAQQPVNIAGTVPQRTQAATPAPAAAAPQVASAAGGGYYIQIASQLSAELAQKSYANMAQKYSGVIGGRGVDIKRADIPGKGTYYRVRVQAGSKDDAAALCGKLKSAGGNCFITQ